MKTNSIFLIILLVMPIDLYAAGLGLAREDGGNAGAFLSFGAGARSLGMGKTFVGVADDASAVYWNPAGLVQLKQKEMTVLYASMYENTGYSFVSYGHPLASGTIGAALINLNSAGFQLRDEFNISKGEAGLSETAAIVSFAKTVLPDSTGKIGRVSAGINFKAINQNINGVSANGFGTDLAAFWTPKFIGNLSVGLNLQNVIAPSLKLVDDSDKYPFIAVLGLGYRLLDDKLLIALDTSKTEGRNIKFHIGSEYTLKQAFHIRAGLDETELTTGLGVTWHGYSIDYAFAYHDAWSSYGNLGISHRFGLTTRF